jgi:hypothetical protein
MERIEMHEKLYPENLQGGGYLKDVGVDMRINLNLILKEWCVKM